MKLERLVKEWGFDLRGYDRGPAGPGGGLTRAAVAYLEADPWAFRTGYFKAELIRALLASGVPENLRPRLARVVVSVVDMGDRREFRHYCRLARAVDGPELRDAMRKRLRHRDEGVRRRSRWVLEALGELEPSRGRYYRLTGGHDASR